MELLFGSPPLSTFSAHILALLMGTAYVGSIYVSKNARLSFSSTSDSNGNGTNGTNSNPKPRFRHHDERWRDDPDVIRARLLAVSVATLLCCLAVFGVIWGGVGVASDTAGLAWHATLLRLGFLIGFPLPGFNLTFSALLPHLITPILYLGPLVGMAWRRELPGQRNWRWLYVKIKYFGWVGMRNYWVAPLTEEVVFRACVLAIYHLSGASKRKMIMLGPLVFGLAHVHHAWDTYNRYGRTSAAAKRAVLSSLFQLLYTTLFGMHVSFLFLRTGSVWPAVSAHTWCNTMGVPDLGGDLGGRDEEFVVDDGNKRTMTASTATAGTSMTTSWTQTSSVASGAGSSTSTTPVHEDESLAAHATHLNGRPGHLGEALRPQSQLERQQRQINQQRRETHRTVRKFTVLFAYLLGIGAFVSLLRGGWWEDEGVRGNVYWVWEGVSAF